MGNANIKQLLALESLKKNFCLTEVSNYGYYSNGDIGVECSDRFGSFAVVINKDGAIRS